MILNKIYMKNLILILFFAFFAMKVSAQLCPVLFQCGGNFVDPRDNTTYPTVTIGTQCWFKVNLQATHYANNESIPNVQDITAWDNLTTGAWCDYDNNSGNAGTYGHLYNWYAASDSRGLCPRGWNVPTEDDWGTLFNHLAPNAVNKLISMSSPPWDPTYNAGATNSSGFSALPGGYRYAYNFEYPSYDFLDLGTMAWFWSSSTVNTTWAGTIGLLYFMNTKLGANWFDNTDDFYGASVRCVRNN